MRQTHDPPVHLAPSSAYGNRTFRAAVWLQLIPFVPLGLSAFMAWDLLVTAARGQPGSAIPASVLLVVGAASFAFVRSMRIDLDLAGRLRQRLVGRSAVDLTALLPPEAPADPRWAGRVFDLRDAHGGRVWIWAGLWSNGGALATRVQDYVALADASRPGAVLAESPWPSSVPPPPSGRRSWTSIAVSVVILVMTLVNLVRAFSDGPFERSGTCE